MACILCSLIIHNLAISLTSIMVSIDNKEAAMLFLCVLCTSPSIETIDICGSDVDMISLPPDIIPHLHTFKGPAHLVLPFVQGRWIHMVVFFRPLEWSSGLEKYLNVLEQSSMSIRTFVTHPRAPWPEVHMWLLTCYVPDLLNLEIESQSIEVGLISKLYIAQHLTQGHDRPWQLGPILIFPSYLALKHSNSCMCVIVTRMFLPGSKLWARPKSWPEHGFGPAWDPGKLKPAAEAGSSGHSIWVPITRYIGF